MLGRLSKIKPLWVELGLQTSNEETAKKINRCYPLSIYEKAMANLKKLNVHRITHIILGLPNESRADMLATVNYVSGFTDGVKLQLLHVIKGTPLAESYKRGEFQVLEPDEYYELVADALELLPLNVVVHRLTGDGAKRDLLAPKWSGDKKRVLAGINRALRFRDIQPVRE